MSEDDRAIDIEVLHWEHINRPRGEVRKFSPGEPGYGPESCVRCDADMPAVRRAHGFHICVDCKTQDELRARSY